MLAALHKYLPYELDPTLPREMKKVFMNEWNEKVSEIFESENISLDQCTRIMDSSHLSLRCGFPEFFNMCYQVNLPFYIISGGVDIFIQSMLNSVVETNAYENFFMFSNTLKFNRKNQIIELALYVNTMTKSEHLDKNQQKFKNNTILFGDSNHDLAMVNTPPPQKLIPSLLTLTPSFLTLLNLDGEHGLKLIYFNLILK